MLLVRKQKEKELGRKKRKDRAPTVLTSLYVPMHVIMLESEEEEEKRTKT